MLTSMVFVPRNGPARTALIAAADTIDEASAALRAGADLVDLTAARAAITVFRSRHPGAAVCVASPPAGSMAELAAALAAHATLICADARSAAASGLPADRVLIDVPPCRVAAAVAAGCAALVDADLAAALAADGAHAGVEPAGPADPAGVIAIAAVASWLGAAAVRTRHVAAVRRALDMAASIRGIRPPSRAIRGLA
jgi:dihydropteroate synthase